MAELRCHACGTAVMPQSIYCSTCGRHLNQPRSLRGRGLMTMMRLLVVLCVAGWIVRVALPVAVRIAPPCGATPSTIAVIPRTLGLIDSQQGVVGGQAFLQAGDCYTEVASWYTITTNQPAFFAVAQRDTYTWSGWLLATSETISATVTQIGVGWLRAGINNALNVYQRMADTCAVWTHWSCR